MASGTNSRVAAAAPAAFYEYDDPNVLYIFVASTLLAVIVLLYTGMSFDPSTPDAEESAPDDLTLHTPRLILRPFRPQDAAILPSLCGDAAVARMCALVPHPYAPDDARFFKHLDFGNVVGCQAFDRVAFRQNPAFPCPGCHHKQMHAVFILPERQRRNLAMEFRRHGCDLLNGLNKQWLETSGSIKQFLHNS